MSSAAKRLQKRAQKDLNLAKRMKQLLETSPKLRYCKPDPESDPESSKDGGLTTGSCGRRGQRAMFRDTSLAGAAQPERYTLTRRNDAKGISQLFT